MLRPALPSDLHAVHAIYMHEQVIPYLGYDAMSSEAFKPVFDALLRSQSFYVWDAEGTVRGFCRASRHEGRASHTAYIGTFAVTPDEQGSGLAKKIIEQIIETLQADGVLRVELMLEADNSRARAFYEKLGFEHEGRLRAAYKRGNEAMYVDELLMSRLLAPVQRKQV